MEHDGYHRYPAICQPRNQIDPPENYSFGSGFSPHQIKLTRRRYSAIGKFIREIRAQTSLERRLNKLLQTNARAHYTYPILSYSWS